MSFLMWADLASKLKLKRTEPWAISASWYMAISTCDGSRSPEAQALPVDTAKPARSR